uniref:RING-type domain-containing protein n=1 Tax=Alexandrium catenella TaxID=2925 RepID=A0A7S1WGS6_ALECA|mmetsp:Transcript_60228/g.161339  ORF Transcript_60228/g.161339 Transcript_60228/m.161339 type:complete len:238 (+) Transcript_60228:29-742(+)
MSSLFSSLCAWEQGISGCCMDMCSKVLPASCSAAGNDSECALCTDCASELGFDPNRARHFYGPVGVEGWDEAVALPGYDPEAIRRKLTSDEQEFVDLTRTFDLKVCPRCRHAVEKEDEDSCDHMTCICGHEFCWSCLADRNLILHHGNHFHNPGCRFWREYNGPLEFVKDCPKCKRTGRPCKPPTALPTLSAANSWMATTSLKVTPISRWRNLAGACKGDSATLNGPHGRSVSRPEG